MYKKVIENANRETPVIWKREENKKNIPGKPPFRYNPGIEDVT
jgi:hypothetical protein